MASINKFIGIGNVTADAEVRYAPSGDAVCSITIACNEKWKSKDGEQKESVEFVKVAFFKKLAEVAGQYLKKGAAVYVEGKLKTRKFTDKQGVERYVTEVHADAMQMLGGRDKDEAQSTPVDLGVSQAYKSPFASKNKASKTPAPAQGGFSDFDSDIPF